MNCTDNEWKHCQEEKRGCEGCHYDDKEDYTSVYLKGIYDERDRWIKKIKKKIDEVTNYGFDNAIDLLEELIEEGK